MPPLSHWFNARWKPTAAHVREVVYPIVFIAYLVLVFLFSVTDTHMFVFQYDRF